MQLTLPRSNLFNKSQDLNVFDYWPTVFNFSTFQGHSIIGHTIHRSPCEHLPRHQYPAYIGNSNFEFLEMDHHKYTYTLSYKKVF
jgi:hypothetical protein